MKVVDDDVDGSVGLGLLELGLELGVALLDLGEALQEDRDPVGVTRALLLQVVQGLPRLYCMAVSQSAKPRTKRVCVVRVVCVVCRVVRVVAAEGQVPRLVR